MIHQNSFKSRGEIFGFLYFVDLYIALILSSRNSKTNTVLKALQNTSANDSFEFGENWIKFLKLLNDDRIKEAEDSLKIMFGVNSLHEKHFLDIGSGSGLFSLAAKKMGARVTSFDQDLQSVKCTEYLKEKFFPGDEGWQISHGSVLDCIFLNTLPKADYVYSWGVLHHTGDMFTALKNACEKVNQDGFFYVALYRKTIFDRFWKRFKKMYSRSGKSTQSFFIALWALKTRLAFLVKGKSFRKMLLSYKENRGMDFYTDTHDWLGGYPYETITPAECRKFFEEQEFILIKQKIHIEGVSKSISGGCDEYLFKKSGNKRPVFNSN